MCVSYKSEPWWQDIVSPGQEARPCLEGGRRFGPRRCGKCAATKWGESVKDKLNNHDFISNKISGVFDLWRGFKFKIKTNCWNWSTIMKTTLKGKYYTKGKSASPVLQGMWNGQRRGCRGRVQWWKSQEHSPTTVKHIVVHDVCKWSSKWWVWETWRRWTLHSNSFFSVRNKTPHLAH